MGSGHGAFRYAGTGVPVPRNHAALWEADPRRTALQKPSSSGREVARHHGPSGECPTRRVCACSTGSRSSRRSRCFRCPPNWRADDASPLRSGRRCQFIYTFKIWHRLGVAQSESNSRAPLLHWKIALGIGWMLMTWPIFWMSTSLPFTNLHETVCTCLFPSYNPPILIKLRAGFTTDKGRQLTIETRPARPDRQ